MPGKEVRSKLICAFDAWLNVPADSLKVITKVVGMLHTASLLIDDVQDSSLLRRGIPVAHQIYGVAQTINSGNYVYFKALHELSQIQNPKLLPIFTEELLNLHRGQGLELFWRDNLKCPTEHEYIQMVNNKTGGLLRLALRLMQAESKSDIDYVSLVNLIGIHFQIRDDYMNLQSDTYADNKGYCEDLTEGKFSFPIIHAIRADKGNMQILNIVKQHTTDRDVKKYAVDYMERIGTFSYTRKVLAKLERQALKAVEDLGGNEKMVNIIKALAIELTKDDVD